MKYYGEIILPCEVCEKPIKRYGKTDFEKRSKLCITCFNKTKFKKEKEKLLEKQCIECKNILSISEFSFTGSGYFRSKCIQCSNLLHSFKINRNDYNDLLISQNHKCKICNSNEIAKTIRGKQRNLAVDHCHSTGKIRGLLCTNCNSALGSFFDKKELLLRAINYLEEYENKD